jgi:TPR repeat protein
VYEDGEGVARNLDEAARIYKAMSHYPSAMLYFAIAHVEGRGVVQDYAEAYKLPHDSPHFK